MKYGKKMGFDGASSRSNAGGVGRRATRCPRVTQSESERRGRKKSVLPGRASQA